MDKFLQKIHSLPAIALALFFSTNSAWAAPVMDLNITSPLAGKGITSFPQLITTILTVLIALAVPLIVIAIVYAGFTYVTAQGNASKVQTATKMLTYAVIGAVLILGALTITQIISDTVTTFT